MTSNNEQKMKRQQAFESQIMSQHRDQTSRLSNSVIGEDHVLVGGRITAGSNISKEHATISNVSKPQTSRVTASVENYLVDGAGAQTLLNSDAGSAVRAQE